MEIDFQLLTGASTPSSSYAAEKDVDFIVDNILIRNSKRMNLIIFLIEAAFMLSHQQIDKFTSVKYRGVLKDKGILF